MMVDITMAMLMLFQHKIFLKRFEAFSAWLPSTKLQYL